METRTTTTTTTTTTSTRPLPLAPAFATQWPAHHLPRPKPLDSTVLAIVSGFGLRSAPKRATLGACTRNAAIQVTLLFLYFPDQVAVRGLSMRLPRMEHDNNWHHHRPSRIDNPRWTLSAPCHMIASQRHESDYNTLWSWNLYTVSASFERCTIRKYADAKRAELRLRVVTAPVCVDLSVTTTD